MEKREQIIAKAWKDPEFKKRLLTKPKETLIEMGWEIPADLTVKVFEDSANTYTFVLPSAPANASELSESELEYLSAAATSGIQC